jgi:uncharacterized protein
MEKDLENRLRQMVRPYLEHGRPGDYEHTLRAVGYARKLLEKEVGEEDIVIPTLYLHDIGWSQVDFDDFVHAPLLSQKRDAVSVGLHMKHGAELAGPILLRLGYPPERVHTIASIIAVHDRPERIFAMENPSALMVWEADFLDKYGPESLIRFERLFGTRFMAERDKNEVADKLRAGLKGRFRTRTARSMALDLARESGLLDPD